MKYLIASLLLFVSLPAWSNEIQMFSTDKAPKPYVILSELIVEARTIESAQVKLQDEASSLGADAILNYDIVGSKDKCIAKGIAIRWARKGEKGLSSISVDTLIPVSVADKTKVEMITDYEQKIKDYRTRSWIDLGLGVGFYGITAGASLGISSKNTLTLVPIFGPIIRGAIANVSDLDKGLMIAGGVLQLGAFTDLTYSLIQKSRYSEESKLSLSILPSPNGLIIAGAF